MMQEWANLVDAWVEGRALAPTLVPPAMAISLLEPAESRATHRNV